MFQIKCSNYFLKHWAKKNVLLEVHTGNTLEVTDTNIHRVGVSAADISATTHNTCFCCLFVQRLYLSRLLNPYQIIVWYLTEELFPFFKTCWPYTSTVNIFWHFHIRLTVHPEFRVFLCSCCHSLYHYWTETVLLS